MAGTPQGTVAFAYDFAGRRVAKTVAGVTTYFLYDGDMLLAELDSAGSVLKSYTWGATGLISERAAGQSRFHLYDSSGNTRLLVTASGTVISRSAYNAWGAPLAGLASATPQGYSGRFGGYTDAETGLILLGARYYAPALGRFLSRDPIGIAGGTNVYAYCGGDPVNFDDPNGLDGTGSHLKLIEEAAKPFVLHQVEQTAATVAIGEALEIAGSRQAVLGLAATTFSDCIPIANLVSGAVQLYSLYEDLHYLLVSIKCAQPIILVNNPSGTAWRFNNGAKLCRDAKGRLRRLGRTAFRKATGGKFDMEDIDVHHRVPLEWAHMFSLDPNRLSNLRGISSDDHLAVSREWSSFARVTSGKPTRAQILQKANEIDARFGDRMILPW